MSIFDVDIELSGEELIKKLRKDIRTDIDQIFDGYNLKREYKFGKYIDGKFVIDKNVRNEEFFDRLAIESEEDLVAYIKDINRVNYLLGEDRHLTINESYSNLVFWPVYSLIKKSSKYIELYIECYSYIERYYIQDYLIIEKFIESNYKDKKEYKTYALARIFGRLSKDRFLYEGEDDGAKALLEIIDIEEMLLSIADEIYEDYISHNEEYFYPSKRKINKLKNELEALDIERIFEKFNYYSDHKVKIDIIEAVKNFLLERDFSFRTKLEDCKDLENLDRIFYISIFEELREKNIIEPQTGLGDVSNYGKIISNKEEKLLLNIEGEIYIVRDNNKIQELRLLHEGDYEKISVAEETGGMADYIVYEWYDEVEVYNLDKGKILSIEKKFSEVYLGSKGNYIYFEENNQLEIYSISEEKIINSIKLGSQSINQEGIYFANGKIIISYNKHYIEKWLDIYSDRGDILIENWYFDNLDNLYKKNIWGNEFLVDNKIYDLSNKELIGSLEGEIQDYYIKVEDAYYGLSDKKLTIYEKSGSIKKVYDLKINGCIEDLTVRRSGLLIDIYLNTKELYIFNLGEEETKYKIIEN